MARGGPRANAGRPTGAIAAASKRAKEAAEAGGIMPLDFMLEIMRDTAASRAERLDMAKAAAPYVHAKLSSVDATVKGDLGLTIEIVKFGEG